MEKLKIEYFAKQIVDAGYRVHKELGPGLLESVYLFCFMVELKRRGIKAEKEVIIEIKAVEILLPVHKAQLISYLKLSDKKPGFRINFNVPVNKEGVHRYVNNY